MTSLAGRWSKAAAAIGLAVMVCATTHALPQQQQQKPDLPPSHEPPPSQTPTGAAGQSLLGLPPVRFEPATYDFGTLKPGGKANGVIMIQNVSDKWLTIKASRASCTCTSVNLANTKIAPGQAVPLDVSYHASSTMGAKTAAVRILFEGYDLIEVPLTATVGMVVRSEPAHIDALKKADGTQALTGEFTVFSMDQKPFRVVAVNGKPPVFANFDAQAESPRNSYILKYDLTGFDEGTCRNAAGERMPGWIVVETDHPDAPLIDLEVRNNCNRRKPATPMDTWAVSDKRILLGDVKAGVPIEAEVLVKWLPKREKVDQPRAVVSESPQFTVELASVSESEDGMLVKLRITPSKDATGLIYGSMRLHGNRQSGPLTVIAVVR